MKKLLFFSLAALALSACSDDEYVGESNLTSAENTIRFNSGTAALTRAEDATSAEKLGNSFVVFGYKSYSPAQTVYDHYTVNFKTGTTNSTESNSAGWEYVGQNLNMLSSLEGEQSIKYWDYSATSYDFIAFSLGKGETAGSTAVEQDATTVTNPESGHVVISKIDNTPKYTITGKLADIAKVYIADRVTAKKTVDADLNATATGRQVAYKAPIKFNFHAATAKVRMGIYETIPGYSVKDVKFYAMGTSEATILADEKQAPTLYASAATIANSAEVVTATVTFPNTTVSSPDYNKAVVTLPADAKSKNMAFGELSTYGAEHKEASDKYIGRASDASNVSICEFVNVFPCTPGALTLKVDYTLVSRDGSRETIEVKGATATVPAEYGNWKPNFAYTYIFKISDNTNGQIGTETGLYPITFDAIVTDTEDGVQETITTVATPSITTYAKGAVNNEYYSGDNIYVSVNGVDATSSNMKLYTATIDANADQGITEASVANAIANGIYDGTAKTYTVTDKDTKKLVVTESAFTEYVDAIDADDTLDGIAVTLTNKAGKFTAAASTIYAVEYTDSRVDPAVKHYKVIRVGAARQ